MAPGPGVYFGPSGGVWLRVGRVAHARESEGEPASGKGVGQGDSRESEGEPASGKGEKGKGYWAVSLGSEDLRDELMLAMGLDGEKGKSETGTGETGTGETGTGETGTGAGGSEEGHGSDELLMLACGLESDKGKGHGDKGKGNGDKGSSGSLGSDESLRAMGLEDS